MSMSWAALINENIVDRGIGIREAGYKEVLQESDLSSKAAHYVRSLACLCKGPYHNYHFPQACLREMRPCVTILYEK